MKSIAFIMNAVSCACLMWLFYTFHKVRRMMKSNAWVIIHGSFVVLFFKWLYDAWLLYGKSDDLYVVIHETFTLVFAVGIAIGFTIFCNDFSTARKLAGRFKSSSDSHKTLSSELVDDLREEEGKENEKDE